MGSEHQRAFDAFIKEQHNDEFIAAVRRIDVKPGEVLALMYDATQMSQSLLQRMCDAVKAVVPEGVKILAMPSGLVELVVIAEDDGAPTD